MTDFRPETTGAIEAVGQALGLAARGTGGVRAKAGRDIVTEADVAVEDHLRRALAETSGHPVIGEERGGQVPDAVPYWLVDPICGTRNFASGVPLYAVNAALVEEGRVTVSVVGDGSTGDVLAGEAGKGAWRVGEGARTALSASALSQVLNFGAWPDAGPGRDQAALVLAAAVRLDRWDVRCLSTTLALGYVAGGRLAGCVLFATKEMVHFAAGALLVSEAGGRVTDLAGQPWALGAASLVCTGDEMLHRDVLALVRTYNSAGTGR
jgi:myo-inositol-1(or 4)-monophosphatase